MVRIFRGGVLDERFEGSVVVIGPRPTTMTGLVRGDLFVRDNSVCDVTGMVSGNLLAERTGKAVLHGRLFVDKGAVVRGKVVGQSHSAPLPPPEKPATPAPAATPSAAPPAASPASPKPPTVPGP